MGGVNFLNLEYFLLLVYRVFTGASANVDISQVPTQTLSLMVHIAWVGLGFAVLLLALFVYERFRLHEVEHAGWHHREEKIKELKNRRTAVPPKNPQWEYVLELASAPGESDWRRAIIEADNILGTLLFERGYLGETIGEKLKSANPIQFTTLNLAWKAHKVRNDIAHAGQEFHLTERDTKVAIDQYRQVFEEFDYI